MKFNDNPAKQALLLKANISQVHSDFEWLKDALENEKKSLNDELLCSSKHSNTEQEQYSLGRLFGYREGLCHNDLLSGNVLLSLPAGEEDKTEPTVTIIDFEYGAHNYIAYDFANHFNGQSFAFLFAEYCE